MCWCDPKKRTPCCGSAQCHERQRDGIGEPWPGCPFCNPPPKAATPPSGSCAQPSCTVVYEPIRDGDQNPFSLKIGNTVHRWPRETVARLLTSIELALYEAAKEPRS